MSLDEHMVCQLKELRKKRGIVKGVLTRMNRFVGNFDPSVDAISLLKFRQEELPRLSQRFDEIQTQIELIVVDDDEKEEDKRSKFENDYFNIRSQIQEIVNTKKALNQNTHNATFNMSTSQSRVQLPPITIPEFNGNIQNWEAFFDCIRSMVHEDGWFTQAQKFYYLRSCVTGAALDLIKSVPMTDANYEVAIERLKQRYDNRGLAIQSHIRSLLDAPYIEHPSAKEFQALHAHFCTHIAALRALNQPTDQWDSWLIIIIVSRLDTATSHSWQLRQQNTELPKYVELERFLASKCIAFENSEAWSTGEGNLETFPLSSNNNKENNDRRAKRVLLTANNTLGDKCPCCTGFHKIYSCEKFKGLSIKDRLTW